jgi:hypothetical protein
MIFTLFFVLSVDLWAWRDGPMVLGIPYMVAYPFILCLCLSAVLYLFSDRYWREGGI